MCDKDVLGSMCDGDVLESENDENDGSNAVDEESGMLLLKPIVGLLSTNGWERVERRRSATWLTRLDSLEV